MGTISEDAGLVAKEFRRCFSVPADRLKSWPEACALGGSRASITTNNISVDIERRSCGVTIGLARNVSTGQHNRTPGASSRAGVSRPGLMISFCAACHAIVERLQPVHTWLSPQLVILWREQRPGGGVSVAFAHRVLRGVFGSVEGFEVSASEIRQRLALDER
jgi:hypothetical protein